MKEIILKHVLKNALDFNGKANANVVLGLTLKENPELKKDVPKVMKEIQKTISEIEKLDAKKIKEMLKKLAPEILKENKEQLEEKVEGPLKPLPNAVKGKVVTRIAPSPSGPLHIGHAYGVSLNYEYAKMYNGKFIVRIEDTNPENISPEAYKLIEDDANWLTNNGVAEVHIQSSRLGIYYDYAEKLVQMGRAYVCTCEAEKWTELKNKAIPCPCRSLSVKENSSRYAKMFNEYAEGEAVLRLKTDIKDKNPAMRDFAIMRIVEHVHPKTGKTQRMWPLMLFSVAIDDHEMGITHVLNGKDHADNAKKEQFVMQCFDWKPPEYKHWGRINFEGFELSTSKTRRAIEEGKYTGWEDARLPFLRALRKRGYRPEAFRKFALEIGLSLTDKTVTLEEFWKNIDAFNREIIEPKANRYFFVENVNPSDEKKLPVLITIKNAPGKKAKINLHPDFPKRGFREFSVGEKVYISMSDLNNLEEGKTHRLMDCYNFKVKNKKDNKNILGEYISESYEEFKDSKDKGIIIHWLPAEETININVIMVPVVKNIEEVKLKDLNNWGKGESSLSKLKEGEIVQFERRYFARLDKKDKNKLIFYYLHK